MSLILKNIDDPRDNLDKAHRLELVRYANARGMDEVTEQMPAILIRKQLRAKGFTDIKIPQRTLGMMQPGTNLESNGAAEPKTKAPIVASPPPQGVEVDAADDLERQFAATVKVKPRAKPAPKAEPKPLSTLHDRWKTMPLADMGINDLRWACREHDIKLGRRTNKPEMRGLLEAKGLK